MEQRIVNQAEIGTLLTRKALEDYLPHRGGMLLLDGAGIDADGSAHGIYRVRGDEWFLNGHFPGNPVVPGVVLCEIMAQSVCVLLGGSLRPGATPMYTGLDRARFKAPVRPGELFETRCRITRARGPFYFAEGSGRVGDRLCVSAEFSFALVGAAG